VAVSICMNHGQDPAHARAKARVAIIGASTTSPSSAIAGIGSSGYESLQSIEERRRRQIGTQGLALRAAQPNEDEVDADDPRRHLEGMEGPRIALALNAQGWRPPRRRRDDFTADMVRSLLYRQGLRGRTRGQPISATIRRESDE
jgi:hypothetical protein